MEWNIYFGFSLKILVRCSTGILLTAAKALTVVLGLDKVLQRHVYHLIEAVAVTCTSVWRESKKLLLLFFFIRLLKKTIQTKSTKGGNYSNPSHRIQQSHHMRQEVPIPRHAHTWKALSLQFEGFFQFSSAESVMTVHLPAGRRQHRF